MSFLSMYEKEEGRRMEGEEGTTIDRQLTETEDSTRKRSVGAVVLNNKVEITLPSSANSVIVSASSSREFDSDEFDRHMFDDHIRRI